MKEVVRTDKAPAAVGPYSAGIKAGDYVFVSGQGPLDPQTKKMPEGIQAQTKQTLENVKAIVEAAGASMADVVKVTVLLTDMGNFKAMNEAYKEYFPEPFPARATYGASLALPGMLIEIEAIAYVGK
jgi:2-iminobutanoate/2-iminopropanoate deaminase